MKILDNLRYEYVADDGRSWKRPMIHTQLYAALGLDPKKHLPKEGLPPQMVGNVSVWVDPKWPDVNQDAKRVWCLCPVCHNRYTAGKLQQHLKVHRNEVSQ
jgi:hypothetical protein